jgi:ketosteroid isomerase-like protein
MSEENVERVRRMIDAWNRGDITGWADALHEDVEWFPLAENPQTEPVHGVDAVREFVADWVKPWDELRIEVTRILDAGDWVVSAGRQTARHESGAEISMENYVACAFRDGKIVEFRWFMNESDALAAAGLREGSD